jgi:hypothetical protein
MRVCGLRRAWMLANQLPKVSNTSFDSVRECGKLGRTPHADSRMPFRPLSHRRYIHHDKAECR